MEEQCCRFLIFLKKSAICCSNKILNQKLPYMHAILDYIWERYRNTSESLGEQEMLW